MPATLMDNDLPPYEELMSVQSVAGLSTDAALDHIGKLANRSHDDAKPDGLRHAIKLGDKLQARELTPAHGAVLDYFIGNCWSWLRQSERPGEAAWCWEQDEIEKEVFHLRRARRSGGFDHLSSRDQCQILTNLGNSLDYVGRFVEAIECFDEALRIEPGFAMARGNRGYGLTYYADSLYDQGHQGVFLRRAYEDLEAALSVPLHEEAQRGFRKRADGIESVLGPILRHQDLDLNSFPLGDSPEEREYRAWCLARRLFLNPLNDLGAYSIAAQDVLTGPSIVVREDEGLSYVGFFNQMKQEYVSARYMYYEGITTTESHFSDKGVLLYNTLDYPCYSLAVERVKSAFRAFYSMFDKISYFLNEYLKLGIDRRRTYFRSCWYKSRRREKGLVECLERCPNWPLRGLFWLSKDLYEDGAGFKEFIDPDAQELDDIRQHLEHKYLKVHAEMRCRTSPAEDAGPQALTDSLARSLCRDEFEEKTLRLMKMARAALIYLSLAVRREEQRRAQQRNAADVILPLPLDTWEDEWKT